MDRPSFWVKEPMIQLMSWLDHAYVEHLHTSKDFLQPPKLFHWNIKTNVWEWNIMYGEGERERESIRCTWWQKRVTTPTWFLCSFPVRNEGVNNNLPIKAHMQNLAKIPMFIRKGTTQGKNFIKTYLWTSRSPLLFVISHVSPLSGSRPGCEISNPYFFTNSRYLVWNINSTDIKERCCGLKLRSQPWLTRL